MHWFKKNIGDYHKKAGRLSMLEHGAYTLLMDSCYDRERFPTEEEAYDWCWARTDEEKAAVRFVLSKFFTLIDGKYVQMRIKEEIEAYHEKAAKNAEIAKKREENRTKRARNVNEALPVEHEAPPNQEPITSNQEPITNSNSLTHSGSARAKTAIPDDFDFDDSDIAFASEHGLIVDLMTEVASFRLHHREKQTLSSDWRAKFQKWLLNAKSNQRLRRA